jgi:hypothetical protein
MGIKNISVKEAARLIGITTQAVYTAIKMDTIVSEREIVNGKIEVTIPAIPFLDFLNSEKRRLGEKSNRIEASILELRNRR